MAAGHSLGEWSAHVAAGTLQFADAVRSVKARGRAMQLAVPAGQGAMAAILALDPRRWSKHAREAANGTGQVVAAANLNSPAQTVISGAKAAVEKAVMLCKAKGRTTRRNASGQRSLPLRTDAAGTRRSGARAWRVVLCRSAVSGSGKRDRRQW